MQTHTTIDLENQVNSIKIIEVRLLKTDKPTKAFIDVKIGPFVLRSFAVIKAKKSGKYFVTPPSKYSNNKNYYYVRVSDEFEGVFYKAVIKAFEAKKEKASE